MESLEVTVKSPNTNSFGPLNWKSVILICPDVTLCCFDKIFIQAHGVVASVRFASCFLRLFPGFCAQGGAWTELKVTFTEGSVPAYIILNITAMLRYE